MRARWHLHGISLSSELYMYPLYGIPQPRHMHWQWPKVECFGFFLEATCFNRVVFVFSHSRSFAPPRKRNLQAWLGAIGFRNIFGNFRNSFGKWQSSWHRFNECLNFWFNLPWQTEGEFQLPHLEVCPIHGDTYCRMIYSKHSTLKESVQVRESKTIVATVSMRMRFS